jgi:hypothetical protein
MKKLSLILPLLILLSPVLGATCEQTCASSGFDYYVCSAFDYTGAFSCHFSSPLSYCYNSYTEKFGTDCATRCFCFKINDCGCSNLECSGVCGVSGCAGTTLNINSITSLPADTFLNDYSTWDVNIQNTGSICAYTYAECHVRSPTGVNYYVTDGCGSIPAGSTHTVYPQRQVNEIGTWQLLSCSIYEAQGEGVCQAPMIYRDEYDFSPTHTWDVTTSSCPPTTFGECPSGYDGYFQCFANHIGHCEFYSGIGKYCWTDFRNCQTFYLPEVRCCSAGACIPCTGTTTTTISGTTTTTLSVTTTTSEVGISDLDEPFNTTDMPDELRFMNNLATGLFNMSGSIIAGLFLLILALSIATILIVIGKRSLT